MREPHLRMGRRPSSMLRATCLLDPRLGLPMMIGRPGRGQERMRTSFPFRAFDAERSACALCASRRFACWA
jgi:hypothetical protein